MKDLRNKQEVVNLALHGTKVSGYESGEKHLKELLAFMNVAPERELVEQALGFLSSKSMEINASNLEDFLKTKTVKTRQDLRK